MAVAQTVPVAGQSVTLTLADEIDVSRGDHRKMRAQILFLLTQIGHVLPEIRVDLPAGQQLIGTKRVVDLDDLKS